MASPNLSTEPEAGALTVEHVTNSLSQIESWIGAIRLALGGLSPEMPLPSAGDLALHPAPQLIRVHKDCPPPGPKKRVTPRRKPNKKKK